jgi:hypothetical protein
MQKYAQLSFISLFLMASILTACATKAPGQNFRLSNDGYATVLSAPHSKPSKEQLREFKEIKARDGQSSLKIPPEYSQLKEEALALQATLKEKEPDNFTEFRYVWEPEFTHLFSFKRNPEETLSRYTSNPNFKAGTQRHSQSFLEAKSAKIWQAMAPEGKILEFDSMNPSGQINMMKGVVEISTGAYEDIFFALPGMEQYRNDPDIEFTFLERRPPDKIIDPKVAPYIKLFLRDYSGGDEVVFASPEGTIQLRNGCFFFKEKDALIIFPESSNLGLDDDGHIIIYNDRGDKTRVGEKMHYPAGGEPFVKPDLAKQLQKACGQYPVVKINDPKSDYLVKKLGW